MYYKGKHCVGEEVVAMVILSFALCFSLGAMYVVRTFRTFGLAIREYVAHLVWRFRLRLPADAGGVFVRWSFV